MTVKLTLKQFKNDTYKPSWDYRVVGIEDTVRWHIGERLSKAEVQTILDNKAKPVKVVIR